MARASPAVCGGLSPAGSVRSVSANEVSMCLVNTSAVAKCTKGEDGSLDGKHLREAKGASKFPLRLAKVFFAKKKLHFENKLCLALGLVNPGGFLFV